MPGRSGPPHRAIGKGGLEQLGIIRQRDHQPALPLRRQQVVERGREREAFLFLERDRDAILVA